MNIQNVQTYRELCDALAGKENLKFTTSNETWFLKTSESEGIRVIVFFLQSHGQNVLQFTGSIGPGVAAIFSSGRNRTELTGRQIVEKFHSRFPKFL